MSTRAIKAPSPDASAGAARLAAIIRGDGSPTLDLALARDAQAHGVQGLLKRALASLDAWESVGADVKAALDEELHRTVLIDSYFRRQTTRAVAALKDAGVGALIFKGEALALTHYSEPHLRPRCDTDVFVSKSDVGVATVVLQSLGYAPATMVAREAVHTQQVFTEREGALRHVIDLHWGVSNRPLFATAFTFDELAQQAVSLGDSDAGLQTMAPVHSLLLACLHRVTHHENSTRLIWLCDIALIADRLSDEDWAQVNRVAFDRKLCAVSAAGLELASAAFGCSSQTRRHTSWLAELARSRKEPAAAYLRTRRGSIGRILLDARHAGTLPGTIRLLASHAFPDAAYMRRAYNVHGTFGLAGSYVHRAARGFRRLVT